MSVTISMPQLGETVTEGTILEWVKQIGEHVAEDDILVEISTDKVDTEVPSPASGILTEILVPAGETVAVGTALAILSDADSDGSTPAAPPAPSDEVEVLDVAVTEVTPAPTAVATAPASATAPPVAAGGDTSRRSVLSPVVRKLAADNGVDLAMVPGSGDGGRITRKDVEAFIASGSPSAPTPAPGAAVTPAPGAPAAASATPEPAAAPSMAAAGAEVQEIPRLRQRIAANMRNAKDTAAHVSTCVEVDFENVERVLQAQRASFKAS